MKKLMHDNEKTRNKPGAKPESEREKRKSKPGFAAKAVLAAGLALAAAAGCEAEKNCAPIPDCDGLVWPAPEQVLSKGESVEMGPLTIVMEDAEEQEGRAVARISIIDECGNVNNVKILCTSGCAYADPNAIAVGLYGIMHREDGDIVYGSMDITNITLGDNPQITIQANPNCHF